MAKTVGVVMTERIVAGLIDGHKLAGELRHFPAKQDDEAEHGEGLIEMPADSLWEMICDHIASAGSGGFGRRGCGPGDAGDDSQRSG